MHENIIMAAIIDEDMTAIIIREYLFPQISAWFEFDYLACRDFNFLFCTWINASACIFLDYRECAEV